MAAKVNEPKKVDPKAVAASMSGGSKKIAKPEKSFTPSKGLMGC